MNILEEIKDFEEEKPSIYERFCKIFSFLKYPVPTNWKKEWKKEIEFTHLKVLPSEIFSSAINFSILIFFFLLLFYYLTNYLGILVMGSLLIPLIFYFLISYPKFYSYWFRAKASSEMVNSIIYLAISLRAYKNLEAAYVFTSKNLTGPLGKDFRKGLWEIYSGKARNIEEVIDKISEKWSVESEEFSQALLLIKNSIRSENMEKVLDKAVNLIFSSTLSRMERYVIETKTPLVLINMFGIMLPLLGLIILPILFLMMPNVSDPFLIGFFYDVFLFVIVYLLIKQRVCLTAFSFNQPELFKIEKFRKFKKKIKIFSLALGIALVSFFSYLLFSSELVLFSEYQLFLSLALIFSISLSFVIYNGVVGWFFFEKNKEIVAAENELPTALREFSIELSLGKPIEDVIYSSLGRLGNFKIKRFFEKVISNIKQIGLGLSDAIFHKKYGAINEFKSKVISTTMLLVVEISKKGPFYLSKALDFISKYLENAKRTSEKSLSILEEITSNIKMQSTVIAPITSGIIVGLTVFTLAIFFYLGGTIQQASKIFEQKSFSNFLDFGYFSILSITSLTPVPIFQIIVGIYLLEITYLLTYLYGEIVYGNDEVSKARLFAKNILISTLIYIILVLLIYFGIKVMINIEELAKGLG
ncbi:MAG: hypothetical protein B6U78_00320 [Candidatus Aenigmarchaeota archaeon ex4484_224]|nr:MAG: hypothetical protein B6U78_00320 [Candidatus Aenigmarchaeota archaeon ex4484_224]